MYFYQPLRVVAFDNNNVVDAMLVKFIGLLCCFFGVCLVRPIFFLRADIICYEERTVGMCIITPATHTQEGIMFYE